MILLSAHNSYWSFLPELLPMILRGLRLTILIAVVGIGIGFVIGSISGFALSSKCKPAKAIAGVYIWIIRGTPMVVQALYVYYVIPKLIQGVLMGIGHAFGYRLGDNFNLSSLTCGFIVISLNSGAFISEIVRGALQGIDPGQKEAALSLGLTQRKALFHVIVPPAFRSMIPALFNQFIISLKDTSLLSVIVVNEMTKETMNYTARSWNTIPAYTTVALFYLALISILMLIQKQVERKINKR